MNWEMGCHRAILINKKVVPCEDLRTWAQWIQQAHRHVEETHIGQVRISTVFLGLDHGFGRVPLWFETMIFGGEHDQYQERYNSWTEAETGHKRAVELVEKCLT